MPAISSANLSFLPWVRQGAASAIATVETLGTKQPPVADVSITLSVNQVPLQTVPIGLRGPADVLGFDRHQVIRTDPSPGSSNFEPNCFPAIEFDRADFPWLFTPARANAAGRLRPWLCLIVIRKQDGVQLESSPASPSPTLLIASPAKPFLELPDLNECWAWAHAQAAAETGNDPISVVKALNGAPQLSLSRLVCPRLLAPSTDYLACVVPTFELGRKAALGLPIADSELSAQSLLLPAWTLTATGPAELKLPVFYSWEFRTGPAGDFASLAQQLKIQGAEGLGRRAVGVHRPGFQLPATVPPSATVQLEGALLPLTNAPGGTSAVLWSDSFAAPFEQALAKIVNEPGLNQLVEPAADPLLAPPLYGRWHAARTTVNPGAANWFDELNLDPRWRIAAGIGTGVIQQHQEALMASAWEQAAEVQPVNQRMRQLQMSMAVGESLHARHLSALTEEMTLRIAAPVFSRVRVPSVSESHSHTLTALMEATSLPVPATGAAMRRLGRQRGPLSRRIVAQGFGRSPDKTWIARLNIGDSAPPAPRPSVDRARLPGLPTVGSVVSAIWNSGFRIVPDGTHPPPLPAVDPLPVDWDYPGLFRAAAAAHLARIRPAFIAALVPHISMSATVGIVRAEMHPRVALANLARAAVSTGDNVLQPTAPGITPIGIETVMMAPSFTEPMYEVLKERSQDLLLPGLDQVKPESVVGLRTNRAFVEAYMVGLNFEMGRELLFRGFPTDQQGTYFRHFWGSDSSAAAPPDIDDLRKNRGRALGTAPAGAAPEQFVLLLRSSLLQRYPNAIIYLTAAVSGNAGTPPPDVFPIFNGSLDPDLKFFGFPLTPAAAVGGAGKPGYFVVIQEHPTEPRFGVDVAVSAALGGKSHLAIGNQPPPGVALKGHVWGRNAAHMAEITRHLPVRITIHASQLVTPNQG